MPRCGVPKAVRATEPGTIARWQTRRSNLPGTPPGPSCSRSTDTARSADASAGSFANRTRTSRGVVLPTRLFLQRRHAELSPQPNQHPDCWPAVATPARSAPARPDSGHGSRKVGAPYRARKPTRQRHNPAWLQVRQCAGPGSVPSCSDQPSVSSSRNSSPPMRRTHAGRAPRSRQRFSRQFVRRHHQRLSGA